MSIDLERIKTAVTEILIAVGEDPARAGLADTPGRVAGAYAELFAGLGVDVVERLRRALPAAPDRTGELVLLRDIRFRSVCEHHLLPFHGVAHVAYVPGERLAGLGDIMAAVEALAARPQLQERLGEELAEALEAGLGARGTLVVLDAVHGCVMARGPRQDASSVVTVTARGVLAEPAERATAIALIGEA